MTEEELKRLRITKCYEAWKHDDFETARERAFWLYGTNLDEIINYITFENNDKKDFYQFIIDYWKNIGVL